MDFQDKPVVVGTVLHVLPENIPHVKQLLEDSPYVLRLVEREGQ